LGLSSDPVAALALSILALTAKTTTSARKIATAIQIIHNIQDNTELPPHEGVFSMVFCVLSTTSG